MLEAECPLPAPKPNSLRSTCPAGSASEPRPLCIHTDVHSIVDITILFVDASYSKCLRGGSRIQRKGFIDITPSAFAMKLNIYWPIWQAASAAKTPSTVVAPAVGLSTFATPHKHIQTCITNTNAHNTKQHSQTISHERSLAGFIKAATVGLEYFVRWFGVHSQHLLVGTNDVNLQSMH